jgi:hypothetical protein
MQPPSTSKRCMGLKLQSTPTLLDRCDTPRQGSILDTPVPLPCADSSQYTLPEICLQSRLLIVLASGMERDSHADWVSMARSSGSINAYLPKLEKLAHTYVSTLPQQFCHTKLLRQHVNEEEYSPLYQRPQAAKRNLLVISMQTTCHYTSPICKVCSLSSYSLFLPPSYSTVYFGVVEGWSHSSKSMISIDGRIYFTPTFCFFSIS